MKRFSPSLCLNGACQNLVAAFVWRTRQGKPFAQKRRRPYHMTFGAPNTDPPKTMVCRTHPRPSPTHASMSSRPPNPFSTPNLPHSSVDKSPIESHPNHRDQKSMKTSRRPLLVIVLFALGAAGKEKPSSLHETNQPVSGRQPSADEELETDLTSALASRPLPGTFEVVAGLRSLQQQLSVSVSGI